MSKWSFKGCRSPDYDPHTRLIREIQHIAFMNALNSVWDISVQTRPYMVEGPLYPNSGPHCIFLISNYLHPRIIGDILPFLRMTAQNRLPLVKSLHWGWTSTSMHHAGHDGLKGFVEQVSACRHGTRSHPLARHRPLDGGLRLQYLSPPSAAACRASSLPDLSDVQNHIRVPKPARDTSDGGFGSFGL